MAYEVHQPPYQAPFLEKAKNIVSRVWLLFFISIYNKINELYNDLVDAIADIATNTADIATNVSDISDLDTRVTALEAGGTLDTSWERYTISGGEITLSAEDSARPLAFLRVDTEGAAASDDLDKINGGTQGQRLVLQAFSTARTVVVKDGTNLYLQANCSLTNKHDKIELICFSNSKWDELSRADNAA
jgi:hypothetical protein